MARLAPLDLDTLTPEQRYALDEVLAGPRGAQAAPGTIPRGPVETWLRSPGLCDPAQKLGAYVRFENALPPHLAELAIILAGAHWRAQFEFWAHARAAARAGVPDAVIEAIRTGARPDLEGDSATVYDFVTQLLQATRVTPSTYARALDAFGERGVVDLVGTVGYYSLVSMTLNAFEVGLPEGETPPFEERS